MKRMSIGKRYLYKTTGWDVLQVSPNSNETLGVLILRSHGFFPEAYWYWIGIGALIGYAFLFNFLFTLALQYLNRKYHLWVVIFSSTSFLITNAFCSLNMLLLQHSEMINQGYPKRSCSREMLQRLKSSSISYKQERALLVSQLALSYRFYVCSLTFGM